MRRVRKRLWQLQANNKVLRSNIVFHTPLLTTRHFTKSHSIWQKEKSASLTSRKATSNAKPTESPSWNKDTLVSAVVESQQVFGIDPKNLDWSNVKLAVSTLLHLFPRDKYQPFQLVQNFGSQFPLYDRKQIGEQMFKETMNRFAKRHLTDRLNHPILLFSAGPGIGKSRVNMEAVQLMIDAGEALLKQSNKTERMKITELLNHLKSAVSVNITFGNGTGCTDSDRSGFKSLANRIIFHHFVGARRTSIERFENLFGNKLPTLSEALSIVREFECQQRQGEVFIFLGIDEYQKLYEFDEQAFKNMYNNVGSNMCSSPPGVFFQPLFTGIDRYNLHQITKCSHPPVHLRPSLLTFQSMQSVVSHISKKYKLLKHWKLSRDFQRMLADIGGYPRALAIFLEQCVSVTNSLMKDIRLLSNEEIAQCWYNTMAQLKILYPIATDQLEPMKNAVMDCLLERKITVITEELIELYTSGFIILQHEPDGRRILIPLIWLHLFKPYYSGDPIFDCIDVLLNSKVESFDKFEDFVAQFLVLMTRLRLLRGLQSIPIADYFRGAHVPPDLKKRELQLRDVQIIHSKEQYSGSGVLIKVHDTLEEIDCTGGKSIVKNASEAPFADIFTKGEFVSEGKDWVGIMIQVKPRNTCAETSQLSPDSIAIEFNKCFKETRSTLALNGQDVRYIFVMITMSQFDENAAHDCPVIVIHKQNFSRFFGELLATRAELEYSGNPTCFRP